MRIRNPAFFLIANPAPNPGFWWPKSEKIQLKFFSFLLIKNCNLLIPRPSIKDLQAIGEAFRTQKRTSSTSKDEIYELFSIFSGPFLPSWIRILIVNPNTDLDPQHWQKYKYIAELLEILTAIAINPFLGSVSASPDTVESEGLQMVQRRILYLHKIRPNWLPKYEPPQT